MGEFLLLLGLGISLLLGFFLGLPLGFFLGLLLGLFVIGGGRRGALAAAQAPRAVGATNLAAVLRRGELLNGGALQRLSHVFLE